MYHYAIFRTDVGFCGIAWSDRGIVRFQLPTEEAAVTGHLLKKRLPDAWPGEPPPAVAEAMAAAHAYFAGQATDFSGCVIDLSGCDTFARRVYAFARRVGWGRTTTYGALAREAGAGPEAARDVGRAMATNPVPLIIPCHRVLAAGGKPGGFSGPGGVATKLRMLALEGIELAPQPPQQSFAFEYPRSSL